MLFPFSFVQVYSLSVSCSIKNRYKSRGYRVFPAIKHYTAFTNAWSESVPLRVHRATHPALKPIEAIASAIVQEIKGGKRGKTKST